MKGSAGKVWTRGDPWWQGEPASRRMFSKDGAVLEPTEDACVWKPCAVDEEVVHWRFATWIPAWQCCGAEEEPQEEVEDRRPVAQSVPLGNRVKVSDFPTSLVWRHPLTWGFVLDSPWSLLTSFPMPLRSATKSENLAVRELARSLTDTKLRNTVHQAEMEVDFYRSGVRVPDKAPSPDEFFVRRDAEGSLEFYIRVEDEDVEELAASVEGSQAHDEEPEEVTVSEDGEEEEEEEEDEEDEESDDVESDDENEELTPDEEVGG